MYVFCQLYISVHFNKQAVKNNNSSNIHVSRNCVSIGCVLEFGWKPLREKLIYSFPRQNLRQFYQSSD